MPRTGKLRRYDEVLKVAGEVIAEKGYENASIQDIADRLGILKGSLYYYVQTKENLLYELIKETLAGSLSNLEQVEKSEGTALEKLSSLIQTHIEYLTDNIVTTTLTLHEYRSLSDEHRKLVLETEQAYERGFERLIVTGQKEGTIRKGLNPKLAALGVLGTINWTYRWYDGGRRKRSVKAPEIGRQFSDLLIEGLRA